ncbi:hypothetical protein ACIA8R_44940 [Nonomuraea sp. NPDC051191]|uniref:hypothetical protein n=1 Tax=Nonomuraea sp. NPDC051191 TaxID=3364372 RepID=UPI00379289D5
MDAVRRFVSGALAAHDARPSAPPAVVAGSRSPVCPFGITVVEPEPDQEDPDRYSVLIHGSGLWVKDSKVTVDGVTRSASFLFGESGRAWDGCLQIDLPENIQQTTTLEFCVENDGTRTCRKQTLNPLGPTPSSSPSEQQPPDSTPEPSEVSSS